MKINVSIELDTKEDEKELIEIMEFITGLKNSMSEKRDSDDYNE